jgi:hypothetical protein
MLILNPSFVEANQSNGGFQPPKTLAVSLRLPMKTIQAVSQNRMDSLIAIGFAELSNLMLIPRKPMIDFIAVGMIRVRQRKAVAQAKKGLFVPVAYVKEQTPTTLPAFRHCRPNPDAVAVRSCADFQIAPHLIQRDGEDGFFRGFLHVNRDEFKGFGGFFFNQDVIVPVFTARIRLMASMLLPSQYMVAACSFVFAG